MSGGNSSWSTRLVQLGQSAADHGRRLLSWYGRNKDVVDRVVAGTSAVAKNVYQFVKGEVPLPDPTSEEDIEKFRFNQSLLERQKITVREIAEDEREFHDEVNSLVRVGNTLAAHQRRSEQLALIHESAIGEINKRIDILNKKEEDLDDADREIMRVMKQFAKRFDNLVSTVEGQVDRVSGDEKLDCGVDIVRDIVTCIPEVGKLFGLLIDGARSIYRGITSRDTTSMAHLPSSAASDSMTEVCMRILDRVQGSPHSVRQDADRWGVASRGILEDMKIEMNHLKDVSMSLLSSHHDVPRGAVLCESRMVGLHCYVLVRSDSEIFAFEIHDISDNCTILLIDLIMPTAVIRTYRMERYDKIPNLVNQVWVEHLRSNIPRGAGHHSYALHRKMVYVGCLMINCNYSRLRRNMVRLSSDIVSSFIGTYTDIRRHMLSRITHVVDKHGTLTK